MARSSAFEEFLAGVNTPVGLSRDSLDEIPNVGAIFLLDGEERAEAEDILISRLATNDGRAATALAEADCFRAIPALIEATTDAATPTMRVFAARALLRLDDYSGRDSMVRLLRTHEGSGTDRGSAAQLLAEFPDPDTEVLLEAASTDPDSTARSEATHALLAAAGLDDDATMRGQVLKSIRGRLLSSLSSVRNEAVAELRDLVTRVAAGEDLDLTWRPDLSDKALRRFVDSIDSTKAEFPIDGLDELTGRARTFVENLVLLRLHADRRAVRAAGRLRVYRAVEPLRELLASAQGPARAEIESVVDTLTR